MSDLSAAQVIAASVDASWELLTCSRDWSAWSAETMGPDDFEDLDGASIAAEALAALAAAGYAVVKLPQPDEDEWGDATWPVPHEDGKRPGYIRHDADGRLAVLSTPNPCATPADARALAAALLAAAQAAESGR